MKTMNIPIAAALLCLTPLWAVAQGLEEIVVTGSRVEKGDSVPGASLKRPGDFILLQVVVSNDSRERDVRKKEIYDTLRAALAAAKRDGTIELSVVDGDGLVIPLKVDSATVPLGADKRPDTSRTTISVKTKIPATDVNPTALISKLKDFVASVKGVGRTELDGEDDVEISVVNPAQYRDAVIKLFAADVTKVTGALGDGYKVVVQGIDRPVRWVRVGLLELQLYVPYTYAVIPTSVTSYTNLTSPAE
ncbi:MAG TPA: hypothetical protein VE046_13985 [Steroidobacteraceae bacterium]|nr:hypothetical protein [Steroidobacteraceae bacterium]